MISIFFLMIGFVKASIVEEKNIDSPKLDMSKPLVRQFLEFENFFDFVNHISHEEAEKLPENGFLPLVYN